MLEYLREIEITERQHRPDLSLRYLLGYDTGDQQACWCSDIPKTNTASLQASSIARLPGPLQDREPILEHGSNQ